MFLTGEITRIHYRHRFKVCIVFELGHRPERVSFWLSLRYAMNSGRTESVHKPSDDLVGGVLICQVMELNHNHRFGCVHGTVASKAVSVHSRCSSIGEWND